MMKKQHIWKCKKCNARIKMLGGIMEKPKQCSNCGSKEFE